MQGGIMAQGSAGQPTNMMVRRLADQGHNMQGNQNFGQVVENNQIIGVSGGMVRMKGNSPKVSAKD